MSKEMPHKGAVKFSIELQRTPKRKCTSPCAKVMTVWLGFVAISLLFTGCGLLPEKEERQEPPVLTSYEAEAYKMVYVEKGTVALEKEIKCTYSQLKEENLSFPLTGESIEAVYFSAGDTVKKGDLLIQLELGDLEAELENIKYDIGELELVISQNKDLLELEITKQKMISEGINQTKEEAKKAMEGIQNQYNSLLQSYEDSLYLKKMKQASLLKEIESHKIFAGMDGTISFLKSELEGSNSKKDEVVVTIINSSLAAFKATTEYASVYTEGEEAIVTTKDNSYETIVLPSQEEEGVLYFQMTTPDVNLEIGDSGTVKLVLDKHEDTLYLPRDVVHKSKDTYYVYSLDETGIQSMKTVEIGLENGENVEIVQGLTYREAVINK